MSRVAEAAFLTWSHLLESERYVLSDPRDPATPAVDEEFRAVLVSRTRALEEFFAPIAQVPQNLRYRLVADASVASLGKLGVQVTKPSEVRDFLAGHPDLMEPLLVIGTEAISSTHSGDEWSLEVYRDPEVNSEYLTLCLRRANYTDDTLDIVGAIGDVTEAHLAGLPGWILVSTDFTRPKGR